MLRIRIVYAQNLRCLLRMLVLQAGIYIQMVMQGIIAISQRPLRLPIGKSHVE